jgi:hypothetical protein
MAIARSKLVDVSVARWHHCVSRCVRTVFLLAEGDGNRKEWLEKRLEELADIFAAALGGFSLMDNHLHVLLRLDPEVAGTWSDDEVVRRWGRLFPPRDKSRQPIPLPERSISEELAGIFERLGLSAQRWQHGMEKLRGDRLVGRFFAASRAKLREIADRIGVRHVVNLTGCPIR